MHGRMCTFPRVGAPQARGRRGAGRGLGQIPLPVPTIQEGSQWLHVRDFDRLLRESQREVLRLQRQIALRNQQGSPPPPRPSGPTARVRAGASAPRLPGEVSTGARAGVWVCVDGGRGQFQDFALQGAQSPEGPAAAHGLQGLGSFPDSRDRVHRPASQRSYLRHARPRGFGFRPPQACAPWGPPHRPCRTAGGTARPQIPGCPGSHPGPSPPRRLPPPPP